MVGNFFPTIGKTGRFISVCNVFIGSGALFATGLITTACRTDDALETVRANDGREELVSSVFVADGRAIQNYIHHAFGVANSILLGLHFPGRCVHSRDF